MIRGVAAVSGLMKHARQNPCSMFHHVSFTGVSTLAAVILWVWFLVNSMPFRIPARRGYKIGSGIASANRLWMMARSHPSVINILGNDATPFAPHGLVREHAPPFQHWKGNKMRRLGDFFGPPSFPSKLL
jgi:hypothetical protein